jgi:hypothetical protein
MKPLIGLLLIVGLLSSCANSTSSDSSGKSSSALNLTGAVTTLAGSTTSGSADGTGTAARFKTPYGIANDGTDLYVSDSGNNLIRKIVISSGVVTTLAGSTTSGSANGTGTAARFNFPNGIASDGSSLYLADTNNNLIRQIVISSGVVTILAGSTTSGSTDGTGTAARFNSPSAIATDGTNLYVSDGSNNLIRKIVISTGVVTTLAGATTSGSTDGTGSAARFSFPAGLATDGTHLYLADYGNNLIRKIVISTGAVTTLAGSTTTGSTDGIGTAARFQSPADIVSDGVNLYVADSSNHMIRKLGIGSGVVTTLAGSTTSGSVDGTGVAARFNGPGAITNDGVNLYVADSANHMIRQIK